jgi:hypothetical protein
VRITSRVALGLGTFVLAAGLVLWFTAHERTGAPLLVILSVGFFYIARVLQGGSGHEAGDVADDAAHGEEEAGEEEISPTIWPFGFSVAAVVLVLGVVLSRWLLVVGLVLVAACGTGWYRDLRRQHTRNGGTGGVSP